MSKATSAEDYKLISSFETVRRTLLDEKYADRLVKPLAYWALPNDRRLPLAFLGRTVGELLSTPFEELTSTPGIGQKKISSLVKLLNRATRDEPPAVPFGIRDLGSQGPEAEEGHHVNGAHRFDPAVVSEALWVEWRDTIRKHDLGQEKLGRLAATLQSLPTVIWHTRLDYYLDLTVAEIWQLKTHGEKRVRVVLEVFHLVHELLSEVEPQDLLALRLAPRFVHTIERWLSDALDRAGSPNREEIRDNLAMPLLNQILTDTGPTVHKLAEGRLGIQGAPQSVRTQSRRIGVTRARIYQLLDECCKVMNVRWPEGKCLLSSLAEKMQSDHADNEARQLLAAIRELLFAERHESVHENGHVLQAVE